MMPRRSSAHHLSPVVHSRTFSDDTANERRARENAAAQTVPTLDEARFEDIVHSVRYQAHNSALNLISTLKAKSVHSPEPLRVATAESLTAGLIFSTLVDVPFGGWYKYGCVSVYDTDAKRVFLGVEAPDVYTHKCAAQMAIGVLKNSNASVAIAVSGNAMPAQEKNMDDPPGDDDELNRLGEVFIAVAGYAHKREPPHDLAIFVQTHVYNFCEPQYGGSGLANIWLQVAQQERALRKFMRERGATKWGEENVGRLVNGFNEFLLTSHISAFIRLQTVRQACDDARAFLNKVHACVPPFIQMIGSDAGRISTMRNVNRGTGINNRVLAADREAAVAALQVVDTTATASLDRTNAKKGRKLFYGLSQPPVPVDSTLPQEDDDEDDYEYYGKWGGGGDDDQHATTGRWVRTISEDSI
jgi:nicotinamide mononucleotide (NMN) deamidase PncC